MSIKKYTNFEDVNLKNTNEGQFLQAEDFFIVTKNEVEESYFSECKYDVMEVAVYDVNNNLLPQNSGNNVAYIKSQNIAEYMHNVTNKQGQKELVINAEKLLNDLGFTNGILKLNINFVRNRVGSDNELERVWIHEISPSREEIRILPLKTKFDNINEKNNKEFNDINKLTKDFVFYKKEILNSLDLYQTQYIEKIDTALETKFGKDFFAILKRDFGLSKFADLRTKIFSDFKTSVTYYLENRYYTLGDSTYGKPSEIRFENCEKYEFQSILNDIENILSNSVNFNMSFLKRRTEIKKTVQREFAKVDINKKVTDTTDIFNNPVKNIQVVFDSEKIIDIPPQKLPIIPNAPEMPIKEIPVKEEPIDLGPKEIIQPPVKPPVKAIEPIEIVDMPPPQFDIIPKEDLPPAPKEYVEPIKVAEQPKEYSGGGIGGGGRDIFIPRENNAFSDIVFEDRDMKNLK